MPDIPFEGPNAFHCVNSKTGKWSFAFVRDNTLYVYRNSTFDTYNQVVTAYRPSHYSRGVVKSPAGDYPLWEQVGSDVAGLYNLYALETGYRDRETEKKLAKPAPQEHKLPRGVWLQQNGDRAAISVQPGQYHMTVFPDHTFVVTSVTGLPPVKDDPLASEIRKYPAYWRPIPAHFKAMDFYRVRQMFPLPAGFESARLDHALKKLLIPGNRTGGKSVYKDLKEAHATLGQWLREHKDLEDAPLQQ